MHIRSRCTIVALCLALLAPTSGLLVARLDRTERDQTSATLQRTIAYVADEYRSGLSLPARTARAEASLRIASGRLAALRQRQVAVREHLVHLRDAEMVLMDRYGAGILLTGSSSLLEQKDALSTLIERAAPVELATTAVERLSRALVPGSDGEGDLLSLTRYLGSVYDGRSQYQLLLQSRAAAEEEHRLLALDIGVAEAKAAAAEREYQDVTATAESIAATVKDVHEQVLALQADLSRIDDKLRRTAARALIERGLLEPGELSLSTHAGAPLFAWPVTGRVTAGFHEDSYQDHFGIPHEAIDIAASQGTPVQAAADGIVFLARDGGQTGYSYLLIGHQGGFATLYGHLSGFTVATGDEIVSGQVIGFSGGTPGTAGAGPMTTGPHLHFELIKDGANIDPRLVLP